MLHFINIESKNAGMIQPSKSMMSVICI